jgi:prepilin-type N-terminal cleavage/methylation domain-containing protein
MTIKHYARRFRQLLKPCSGGERAFTLVELICVLALLALLLAVAAPAMAGFGTNRNLEITARAMATDFRKSQQKAITCGWTQLIEFRKDAAGLDLYRLKDGKTGKYTTVKLAEGIRIQSNNFPLVSSIRTLAFQRSGAPNSGGTVVLENKTGKRLYLIVTPATGRVRISESPPENW